MKAGIALGGGGPVGTAWYAGLLGGLTRHGFHLADHDVVLGTSAGAAAGAWLASGRSSAEFAERVRRSAAERGSSSLANDIDFDVVAAIYTELGNAEGPLTPDRVRELCRLASNADEDPSWFIDLWGQQLPDGPWPPALRVAVVDADSGVDPESWTPHPGCHPGEGDPGWVVHRSIPRSFVVKQLSCIGRRSVLESR